MAPMGLTAGNINSGINPGESQTEDCIPRAHPIIGGVRKMNLIPNTAQIVSPEPVYLKKRYMESKYIR